MQSSASSVTAAKDCDPKLSMDFDKLQFLTAEQIKFLELRAEYALHHLTPIEQSDSLEAVGIAKYFNGDYQAAVYYLEAALSGSYRSLKSNRRSCYIFLLLGILYFRLGDLVRCEGNLFQSIDTSSSCGDKELQAFVLSNLAVTRMRSNEPKEAIKFAKEAVELAMTLFSAESPQYTKHVRVLISVYIRNGEFAKAEHLAEENLLPSREQALIRAGIKFAHGNYRSAGLILIDSIQHESRATTAGRSQPGSPLSGTPRSRALMPLVIETGNHSSEGIAFNDEVSPRSPKVGSISPRSGALSPRNLLFAAQSDAGSRARTPKTPHSRPQSRAPDGGVNDLIGHKYQQQGMRRKRDYLEEFHQDIMQAMVTFNLEVMRAMPPPSIAAQSDASEIMEEFVKKMHTRLQKVNIDYPADHVSYEPDPYLTLPFNQHPDYMSFDSFMYPVVVLCTMLASSAEEALLTAHYTAGLRIEAGCMSSGLDIKGLDKAINELKEKFGRAVKMIERSFPRAVIASTPVLMVPFRRTSIMSIAGTSGKNGIAPTSSVESSSNPPIAVEPSLAVSKSVSVDQQVNGANPFDTSFVVRAEAGTKGMFAFGAYSTAYSSALHASKGGDGSQFSEHVPEESDIPDLSVVKDHAIGYGLLSEMKRADIPTEPIASSALLKLRDEYGIELDPETGLVKELQLQQLELPSIASSKRSKKSGKTVEGSSSKAYDADDKPLGFATSEEEAKAASAQKEGYKYEPQKHDMGTIHAEILPLLDHFGRNEISAWIEWAVSTCGGASMAILGQNCSNPREKVGLNWQMMAEEQPSKALLQEVRNRLLEVESKVSATPTNAKAHLDQQHVNIETRVIIHLLLTKISAQLEEQKDTGHYLYQLERICDELQTFQARSIDSLYYSAIATRMRMDFEEWSVPQLVSDGWILTFLVNKMLPLGKRYLKYSEELRDVIMQRDALKRMMNIYLEVSNIPLSEDHDEKSQTLSQLADVSASLIEENEANNPEWVQKNGHLRAAECMHKMREISHGEFAD